MHSDDANQYEDGHIRKNEDNDGYEVVNTGLTGMKFWEPIDEGDILFEDMEIDINGGVCANDYLSDFNRSRISSPVTVPQQNEEVVGVVDDQGFVSRVTGESSAPAREYYDSDSYDMGEVVGIVDDEGLVMDTDGLPTPSTIVGVDITPRHRLSSLFALGSRSSRVTENGEDSRDIVTREICDENFENCKVVSREERVGSLPAGVDKRETLVRCDGDFCSMVKTTDKDSNGIISTRQSTNVGNRSSSKVVGGLEVIHPEPSLIEPYTTGDTNISPHILAFVNAPGAISYNKTYNQFGRWIMWGSHSCGACTVSKRLLSEYNQVVHFLNRDTATDEQKRWVANKGVNLEGSVPQTLFDNRLIGGSDRLKEYLSKK
jgi:glutaredoxin